MKANVASPGTDIRRAATERGKPMSVVVRPDQDAELTEPSAVLCGTYKRSHDLLQSDYLELVNEGCAVLSPADPEFVETRHGFPLARHELSDTPREIETRHLSALMRADFVWLHAPDGYVGLSAAMELGVAHTVGLPVFCREKPHDITLGEFVSVVPSPSSAVDAVRRMGRAAPSRALGALQRYYMRVAKLRGYGQETPQDCILLLTEEMGELARAIRKRSGLTRAQGYSQTDAALELADVQLYIVHLANTLGVDLAEAVRRKEEINSRRTRPSMGELTA